jgi:hypothetical protein
MYIYILTLIPILYFLYRYIPCNNKENTYELILNHYNPTRKIDFNKLKNHSQCVIIPFIEYGPKNMTHKVFKTIEFTTAEMLIRLCVFRISTKDDYIQGLIDEKIRKLILTHLEIFEYSDDLAVSLIHKVYMNLCNIDTDLLNTLNEVNKQLMLNLRVCIDKNTLSLNKNFFWTFNLKYNINNLTTYIKFVSQNRTF